MHKSILENSEKLRALGTPKRMWDNINLFRLSRVWVLEHDLSGSC
jgi:hypothetical protein